LRDEIQPKAVRPQQQLGTSAGGASQHREGAPVLAGKVFAARFGNSHRSGRVCLVIVVPQPRHAKVRVVGPLA
jgi:hypothetical protein